MTLPVCEIERFVEALLILLSVNTSTVNHLLLSGLLGCLPSKAADRFWTASFYRRAAIAGFGQIIGCFSSICY